MDGWEFLAEIWDKPLLKTGKDREPLQKAEIHNHLHIHIEGDLDKKSYAKLEQVMGKKWCEQHLRIEDKKEEY